MSLPEYNGWWNYPTWNVAQWLKKEEGHYRHWNTRAQEIHDDTEGDIKEERQCKAIMLLADELKTAHEVDAPETSGIYADLLGWVLRYVEWRDVAKQLIKAIEPA